MGYHTQPGASPVTLTDFIVELFCRVDDAMVDVEKDPRALLWPSELVTLALLHVLHGKGQRAFYRWIDKVARPLFPHVPERTRLFRLITAHQDWADRFLAEPSLIGFSDSIGIELIHPRREGRSPAQIGKKGKSNHRWIIGVKFCPLLNGRGQIVDWDVETANVHDGEFQRMIADYESACLVWTDTGFHRSPKRGGDCTNLVLCQRGQHNFRMVIESVFSGICGTFGMKKIANRTWASVEARLGFASALWNLLTSWATEREPEAVQASLSVAWASF